MALYRTRPIKSHTVDAIHDAKANTMAFAHPETGAVTVLEKDTFDRRYEPVQRARKAETATPGTGPKD